MTTIAFRAASVLIQRSVFVVIQLVEQALNLANLLHLFFKRGARLELQLDARRADYIEAFTGRNTIDDHMPALVAHGLSPG